MGYKLSLTDISSVESWRSSLAEFIATFLFVFIGAGSVVSISIFLDHADSSRTGAKFILIAMSHGLAIAVLVSATARISGGHINPAVTFSIMLAKKLSIMTGAMYITAQLFGAILGALLLKSVIPEALHNGLGTHGLAMYIDPTAGVVIEAVLTFALVFVIFTTAVDTKGLGNIAPFAIGITVLIDHLIAIPLTGASMNPARTLGPAFAMNAWNDHWVYWVGPLLGGGVASILYTYIFASKEN
jgi:aquaporin TIP